MKQLALATLTFFSLGCAHLYHYQLSEIDNDPQFIAIPIEVKVSEMGVDIHEAGRIAGALSNGQGRQNARSAENLIGMFQMGPRTGAPVYDPHYAEKIIYQLHQQCPQGRLTGLVSIREQRKYPVISGEIVKVTGYCLRPREKHSDSNSRG
jgi:hypothetical protein